MGPGIPSSSPRKFSAAGKRGKPLHEHSTLPRRPSERSGADRSRCARRVYDNETFRIRSAGPWYYLCATTDHPRTSAINRPMDLRVYVLLLCTCKTVHNYSNDNALRSLTFCTPLAALNGELMYRDFTVFSRLASSEAAAVFKFTRYPY